MAFNNEACRDFAIDLQDALVAWLASNSAVARASREAAKPLLGGEALAALTRAISGALDLARESRVRSNSKVAAIIACEVMAATDQLLRRPLPIPPTSDAARLFTETCRGTSKPEVNSLREFYFAETIHVLAARVTTEEAK